MRLFTVVSRIKNMLYRKPKKSAQRTSCQFFKVQYKYGKRNGTPRRCVELCSDESQVTASLCKDELPIDFNSCRHCMQFFVPPELVLFRTLQRRSGYANTFAFAKSPVDSVTVFLIDQHSLRIATGSLAVHLSIDVRSISASSYASKVNRSNWANHFSSMLISSFSPNSTGAFALPRTIGRIYN